MADVLRWLGVGAIAYFVCVAFILALVRGAHIGSARLDKEREDLERELAEQSSKDDASTPIDKEG
jgi:hypothetical protein